MCVCFMCAADADICSVLSIIYHYPSKQFKGNLETIRGRKQISHSKGGEEETEEGTKKVWPPAFNEEETKICFHLISIQFVSNATYWSGQQQYLLQKRHQLRRRRLLTEHFHFPGTNNIILSLDDYTQHVIVR